MAGDADAVDEAPEAVLVLAARAEAEAEADADEACCAGVDVAVAGVTARGVEKAERAEAAPGVRLECRLLRVERAVAGVVTAKESDRCEMSDSTEAAWQAGAVEGWEGGSTASG